jgi:hypothetical protein
MGFFDFLKRSELVTNPASDPVQENNTQPDWMAVVTQLAEQQAALDAEYAHSHNIQLTPEMLQRLSERRAQEAMEHLFGQESE